MPHKVSSQSLEELEKELEEKRKTREVETQKIWIEDRKKIEHLKMETEAMKKAKKEGKIAKIIKLARAIEETATMR